MEWEIEGKRLMFSYNEHLLKNFDIKPAVLDIVDRAENS